MLQLWKWGPVSIICSSGVPTGNGELAKSELVDRTNNFGLWPIVLFTMFTMFTI